VRDLLCGAAGAETVDVLVAQIATRADAAQEGRRHMNVAFVTFANSDFAKSLDRIHFQAIDSRFFNKYFVFTENDLPAPLKDFCESNKHVGKGYGLYIWKPFLANKVAQMPEMLGSVVYQ
jgi:hypothetical protein